MLEEKEKDARRPVVLALSSNHTDSQPKVSNIPSLLNIYMFPLLETKGNERDLGDEPYDST